MTTYYLVRHGQTEWNRVERFRGREEVPLYGTGRAQAQALAARLASFPIARIYSSPLGRSRETAGAIAQVHGQEVVVLPGLVDIDYGEWQGLPPQEVATRYPELFRRWLGAPHAVHFPGGESLGAVRRRVSLMLQELAREHPGDEILLVGHQAVNRVILLVVLGLPNSRFWRMAQDNACVNAFHWEKNRGFSLSLLNDTCHLAD